MDRGEIKNILDRRIENVFPSKESVVERLIREKRLSFYFGIDPTSDQIHIGHTIPLLLLKNLAEAGHRAIVLFGGFTAQIGDPTGKGNVRKTLTREEVEKNKATYADQVRKIFKGVEFEQKDNLDWLGSMKLSDLIYSAKHFTVQQMLARDMFQERVKKEEPIFLHEFLYPLLQGLDSVEMGVDGEVGGNDQTFNMLIGRELAKASGKDKIVLATKLLIDSKTGKKMSKSEGELIAINDTPQEIRRKVLNLDDGMIANIFRLCTEKDLDWILNREQETKKDSNPKQFKEDLANELARMYHGGEAAGKMNEPQAKVSAEDILDALKKSKLVRSVSEAKNLLTQGAVDVNGRTVKEWGYKLKTGDRIRVGKGNFILIE